MPYSEKEREQVKKKVKYIIIFVLIVIINLGIYFRDEIQWEFHTSRIYYLQESSVGNVYIQMYIITRDEVILNEGKRTIILKSLDDVESPLTDEYINRNCVIWYDKRTPRDSNYMIDIYNQPEVKVQTKNASVIWAEVWTRGYGPECDVIVQGWNINHMEVSVHENDILFQSDEDFGQNTKIYTSIEQTGLQQLDFEVHSFEMRKNAEGKYRVYLDMDGDGVYEREYGEYTEKWSNKEYAQENTGSSE